MERVPPELLFSLVKLDFLLCKDDEDEEGAFIVSKDSVDEVSVSLLAAKIGSEHEAFNVMLLAFRRGRAEPREERKIQLPKCFALKTTFQRIYNRPHSNKFLTS